MYTGRPDHNDVVTSESVAEPERGLASVDLSG